MEDKTIFDKILAKEIPSTPVFENDWVYAFKDIAPKAPVHVIIIPKSKTRGLKDIAQLSDQQICGLMKSVPLVAEACGLHDGYRAIINEGKDGQQTVEYIHIHLLGGKTLHWNPA